MAAAGAEPEPPRHVCFLVLPRRRLNPRSSAAEQRYWHLDPSRVPQIARLFLDDALDVWVVAPSSSSSSSRVRAFFLLLQMAGFIFLAGANHRALDPRAFHGVLQDALSIQV
jgi:hypothetical protein